jgi:hypothetical protein
MTALRYQSAAATMFTSLSSSGACDAACQIIMNLNRVGIKNFHCQKLNEASDCFLSAIKILKRLTDEGCSPSDNYRSAACAEQQQQQESNISTATTFAKSSSIDSTIRTSVVLEPVALEPYLFAVGYNRTTSPLSQKYDEYSLVSFVLIYNLASTMHHRTLFGADSSTILSRTSMIDQALRLYQCAYDGLSSHEYTTFPPTMTVYRSRFIVLGQRLLLSTLHNTGLLLRIFEGESSVRTTFSATSSIKCFQVVLATVHSMKDYCGINQRDFPHDFDLDMVIQTALEQLSVVGDSTNCIAAPCA